MPNDYVSLVSKVWNYAHVLRDEGIAYGDYLEQITYLLFLKMDDEREHLLGEGSRIPEQWRWARLRNLRGDALELQYRHALESLGSGEGMLGTIFRKAQNKIQDPAKLRRLVAMIDEEIWLGLKIDVKGAIYEGLLQHNAEETKSGAGQYFTPRPLIDAIVEVMQPAPGMTVHDPACGTGGFLLSAYEHMKTQTQDRALLRRAAKLLEEAGWTIQGGKRRNAGGEVLSVEFLDNDPMIERLTAPLVKNLKLLGIDATMRQIDSAQYQRRRDNYDFDIVMQRYSLGLTPGIEVRSYWMSDFAKLPGSRNLSGIANPAIDDLVEKVVAAPTRDAQITAARALDRVLRAGHYWIPQWHKNVHHLAFWDRFARPETKPRYHRGVITTWWADAEKTKTTGPKD